MGSQLSYLSFILYKYCLFLPMAVFEIFLFIISLVQFDYNVPWHGFSLFPDFLCLGFMSFLDLSAYNFHQVWKLLLLFLGIIFLSALFLFFFGDSSYIFIMSLENVPHIDTLLIKKIFSMFHFARLLLCFNNILIDMW